MNDKFVYFAGPVGMAGPIKIGCTEMPIKRLRELMVWSPLALEMRVTIPGGFDLEHNLHECFHKEHSHLEWFHASPKLLGCIDSLQRGLPVEQAVDLSDRISIPHHYGNRQPWSESHRLYMSCQVKISAAVKRASELAGRPMVAPQNVRHVAFSFTEQNPVLAPEDAALLEEFRADPLRFCIAADTNPSTAA